MEPFNPDDLKKLWRPEENSNGEDNGQITIIGGSELFTGAPLFSMVAASRLVDMVFVATPDEDKQIVSKVKLFSKLRAVIWVPRGDLEKYIQKSDAVLIGPGLMRYAYEGELSGNGEYDAAGSESKMLTHHLLTKFKDRRWVIDGGSLQVMDKKLIPKGVVLTPNKKEFELLFGRPGSLENVVEMAKKHQCVIVYKGPVAYVSDGNTTYEIKGGNAGLTKGGTGDVLAGVIVGLLAKNEPLLAAASGMYFVKKTAERLYEKVGYGFNADDLAEGIFETKKTLVGF